MRNLIGCIAIITFLCTGCSTNPTNRLYSEDDQIISEEDTFNLNDKEQKIEGQVYRGQLEFEGMDTLWTYEVEEDIEVALSYLLSLSSGKAKLVHIDPEGEVSVIVENKDVSTQAALENCMLSLRKGENRIKLVAANKAQIDMQLEIGLGTFNKVGF